MTPPWLSVLIPTYNGQDYLRDTLDSILKQGQDHLSEIECIVIDDDSTDDTLSILTQYKERLPLTIIQRKGVGNWVTNTNYALSIAKGEYISILHQDDCWFEHRLETLRPLVERYPNVNLFLHPVHFINIKGKYLGWWRCPLPSSPKIIDSDSMRERLLIQNFISVPAALIKCQVALEVGGLHEQLWYTADWDFWLKIAATGKTLYYPQALAAFRVHGNSQTVLRSSYIQEFKDQMTLVLKEHIRHWETKQSTKKKILKIALFSVEVNTTLAAFIHKQKTNLLKLMFKFLLLGITGGYLYLNYSRIWERFSARVRAKLMN